MTASITKIKSTKVKPVYVQNIEAIKPKKAKGLSAFYRRKQRRQAFAATGIGIVAFTLTALSLSHLAHGIEIVTQAPVWESWAMAIGIDLGFIALEMATICAATDGVRKQIGKFAKPAILGTLAASALMNAFAFASSVTSWQMQVPAVCLGVAVPALIYSLVRIGAAMWLNCDKA